MNRQKTIILIAAIVILFFGTRQLLRPKLIDQQPAAQPAPAALTSARSTVVEPKKEPAAPAETKTQAPPVVKSAPVKTAGTSTPDFGKLILFAVPFTSQAPLAQWSDPHFQYACEEASSLMAVRWAMGEGVLTKTAATNEILDIVAYEEKTINNYRDTSASETLNIIIKGYFKYTRAELRENSNVAAIKSELDRGNVLILPMNGKKLKNPNFKNGGPEEHMILIRGYDPATKEFITNDPGTRNGEGYRYPEEIIWSAWRDYPSGDHLPIVGIRKTMIVVRPTVK